jgi:signal transduction histidine kinase/BarA-like signal transduction histidine kinase
MRHPSEMKILLVEDDEDDYVLCRQSLMRTESGSNRDNKKHKLHFELDWVHTLTEGTRRLAQGGYHAVVLDLGLPDAKSLEGPRLILKSFPDVPLILLTNRDDDEIATVALSEGAQDYLIKGLSDDKLLSRSIIYAIERHQARRDLERARAVAEEALLIKTQFIRNMSHELRTPLNGIIGLTDLILETALDADQKDNLLVVRQSAASLHRCIEQILDFAEFEKGHSMSQSRDFPLVQTLEDLAAHSRAEIEHAGLRFEASFAPELPRWVFGDPHHLRQVLINLLDNAIKFTPQGGVVRVSAGIDKLEAQRYSLLFCVTDTGIGIDDRQQGHIFEPFTQADVSDTRRFGGTGIGLALARTRVQQMGGSIWVHSTVGKGSSFYFTVTFEKATCIEAPQTQAKPARLHPEGAPYNLRVLVVEDNETNRRLMQRLLAKMGCRVTMAENGQIAHERTARENFDVILMDVQMPVMDGLEATRLIRARERQMGSTPVPIIAVTAHSQEEDTRSYFVAGMTDCIEKPIDIRKLRSTLAALIPLPTTAPQTTDT